MKFLTQAAKVRNEQKKDKRRLAVFLCLAVIVALGTAAALKMYGQAMSHKDKRLICQVEAHQHTDQCYDGNKVICGYADYIVHTHNDDCYDGDGNLVCHLQEAPAHVHTDECYTEEKVLVCKEEEQAHQHTESCYTPEKGELQCQLEEHTHGEECYDSKTGELTCQIEEHKHDDNCYVWEEVLTCPYAAESHQHSDECYTKEKGELQCQIEEHTHAAECYNENNELICEKEEHTHNDDCYEWNEVLTCQLEETPAGHTHTDACYETKKVLTCGQLELHTHDESCLDENGALVCGLLELKEHTHQAECFETVELTDEEVAAKLEAEKLEESFHSEDSGDASSKDISDVPRDETGDSVSDDEAGNGISGNDISGNSVSEDSVSSDSVSENDVHVHDESCYDAAGGLMCGYAGEVKKHTHSKECYDKSGKLICGYDIEEEKITKTCEKDNYIVTAAYSEDANIPEEAELIAEQITADSDSEHYEEREKEFQEILEDKNATMGALFKMGFYVDGKEVEPESPVTITVQFLDENGLKKGRPIKVVHFADKGSEVVQGDTTASGNAIFEVSSFSEIAIGNGSGVTEVDEDGTIFISKDFSYENETFNIAFHLEGEAVPYEDLTITEKPGTEGNETEAEGDDESTTTEESNVVDSTETEESTDDNEEPEISGSDEDDAEIESSDSKDEETESEDSTTDEEESEVTEDTPDQEGNDSDKDQPAQIIGDEEPTGDSDKTSSEDGNEKKGLELEVTPLTEGSEEYQAILEYSTGAKKKKKETLIQGVSYSLTYNGVKMDLSHVETKAIITPTEAFKEETNKLFADVLPDSSSEEPTIYATVIEVAEGVVNELGIIPMNESSTEWEAQEHQLNSEEENGIVALSVESDMANPNFTVQYYANLDIISKTEQGALDVINTRKDGTGTGGVLPTNNSGGTAASVKIDLEGTGEMVDAGNGYTKERHKVKSNKTLTEVYAEKTYSYTQSPALTYFNTLVDNDHYKLSAIWVLKDGRNKNSKNTTDWDIYTKVDGKETYKINGKEVKVHFTNRPATANASTADEKFILITDDDKTVIRLVYDTTPESEKNATKFYDYDISDGKIYDGIEASKKILTRDNKYHEKSPAWYMYTDKKGINSDSNYTGTGTKLAFGNDNTRTTLNRETWNNGGVTNYPNKTNSGQGFKGCTFGLADSLKADGTIQYANGIIAPNLFNEKEVPAGKTEYDGSLTFNRNGDTYTMTTAEVAGQAITKLDLFNHPANYGIWTNNFWPMDNIGSAGTDGHDLMFGTSKATANSFTFSDVATDAPVGKIKKEGTPLADDFKIHNSYFGMWYTVDFKLTDEYVGPLEYLFYGDDDMWVFLSKKKSDGTYEVGNRICDIGGVHSSVGAYVDLWDWIKRDKDGSGNYDASKSGEYRLSFFYTERGASGSSCWMQFTLPSVSFAQPKRTTGMLNVEKEIFGGETEDEFNFNIRFTDKDNNWLKDDYVYTKFSKDGTPENRVLVWDDSYFTLKAGERIEINYLPLGTKYRITELGPIDENTKNYYIPSAGGTDVENTKGDDPNAEGKPVASGVITSAGENYRVKYTNTLQFELPETGGSGKIAYIIAGVFCIMAGAVLVYRKKIVAKRA